MDDHCDDHVFTRYRQIHFKISKTSDEKHEEDDEEKDDEDDEGEDAIFLSSSSW